MNVGVITLEENVKNMMSWHHAPLTSADKNVEENLNDEEARAT